MWDIIRLTPIEMGFFLFIAIMMILGFRKGLIRALASLIFAFLPLILSLLLAPKLADIMMNNTTLYTSVKTEITREIKNPEKAKMIFGIEEDKNSSKGLDNSDVNKDNDSTVDSNNTDNLENKQEAPVINMESLEKLNLPKSFISALKFDENNNKIGDLQDYLSSYLSKMIIRLMSFVIVFIATAIAIKILRLVLGIVENLPILSGFNRFFGALLGGAKAILFIWVFFIVLTIIYTRYGYFSWLMHGILDSGFLRQLYDDNLIYLYLT